MSTQIKRRKWNWIGHILGKEMEPSKERPWIGTRKAKERGRPRHTWRRSVHNEALKKGKSWNEVKRMAGNRIRWRCFVDAQCPLRDNRNWLWWWWIFPQLVIKFPTLYAAEMFIIAVTTPGQLFHPIPDKSTSSNLILLRSNLIISLHICLESSKTSLSFRFSQNLHVYLLSCACHVFSSSHPPLSDNPKYLAKSANNEAFRYPVLTSLLSLPSFYVQINFSTSCSPAPSAYILPLTCDTPI